MFEISGSSFSPSQEKSNDKNKKQVNRRICIKNAERFCLVSDFFFITCIADFFLWMKNRKFAV